MLLWLPVLLASKLKSLRFFFSGYHFVQLINLSSFIWAKRDCKIMLCQFPNWSDISQLDFYLGVEYIGKTSNSFNQQVHVKHNRNVDIYIYIFLFIRTFLLLKFIRKIRKKNMWRFRNYQRTPNRMLTRRLPDTKCINASPRIRLHASIRLKSKKEK